MKLEHFVKVVEEALDSLPKEFRTCIRNVAVLVEDIPPNQPSPQPGHRPCSRRSDTAPTCRTSWFGTSSPSSRLCCICRTAPRAVSNGTCLFVVLANPEVACKIAITLIDRIVSVMA